MAHIYDRVALIGLGLIASSMFWEPLLESVKLSADNVHEFNSDQIAEIGPVTHIRLNIFPDGGVSRLRLPGTLA